MPSYFDIYWDGLFAVRAFEALDVGTLGWLSGLAVSQLAKLGAKTETRIFDGTAGLPQKTTILVLYIVIFLQF